MNAPSRAAVSFASVSFSALYLLNCNPSLLRAVPASLFSFSLSLACRWVLTSFPAGADAARRRAGACAYAKPPNCEWELIHTIENSGALPAPVWPRCMQPGASILTPNLQTSGPRAQHTNDPTVRTATSHRRRPNTSGRSHFNLKRQPPPLHALAPLHAGASLQTHTSCHVQRKRSTYFRPQHQES